MNTVEALNELFIELCSKKQNEFVREIINEWDNMYGSCPSFQNFVEIRMGEKWEGLHKKN